MKRLSHFPSTIAALKRHEWVCLFLVFPLLYNPFLAAPRTTGVLEVGHPASYRATVGASELQHFTPADGWVCFSAPDTDVADAVVSPPEISAESFFVLPPALLPAQQSFGHGVWFRPPPAR